jgi:hypothetical protein
LSDPLEHPFYWWPRTLLTYPIEFHQAVDLDRMVLTNVDTGEKIPIQFSDVKQDHEGPKAATLGFFSDLPNGGHREFMLSAVDAPIAMKPQVGEVHEGNVIILDSGVMRVRIPQSHLVHGDAPGPVMEFSRGGKWIGSSALQFDSDKVTRISTRRVENGLLLNAYEITYETEGGSRHVARVQCCAGLDFVRLNENMEGLRPGARGAVTSTWTGFDATHRQAPNHPFPLPDQIQNY